MHTAGIGRSWPRRRLLVVVAAVLLVLLAYKPLLRGVYLLLVSESQDAVSHYRYAVIVFGDPVCFRMAGELIRSGQAGGVLIVQQNGRAVQAGAVPSLADVAAAQLTACGIQPQAIEVLSTEAATNQQLVRELDRWLKGRSAGPVAVVCPRYQTRYFRTVIDTAVAESRANSIHLYPVSPDSFNEDEWWSSSTGIKRVSASYLRLLHAWCCDEPVPGPSRWTAEQYELWLKNIKKTPARSGDLAGVEFVSPRHSSSR